jgi:hypothetical protein
VTQEEQIRDLYSKHNALAAEHQRLIADYLQLTARVQSGWGYLVGNGTPVVDYAVLFPYAFAETPMVVILGSDGAKATASGVPTGPGDLPSLNSGHMSFNYIAVSTTGFTVRFWRATNILATYNYPFMWIACKKTV